MVKTLYSIEIPCNGLHSDGAQSAFVQGLLEVLQKIPLLFGRNTSTFQRKYLYV